MVDPRFYKLPTPLRVEEVAHITDATPAPGSDLQRLFSGVASLAAASSAEVSYLSGKKHIDAYRNSAAGACFVSTEYADEAPDQMIALIVDNPQAAYARLANSFFSQSSENEGISPSAIVHPSARLGEGCSVGPGALIQAKVEIGSGSVVGAHTVIGRGVMLGHQCHVGPHVTLTHSLIGDRVIIHAGARLGQDGFGYVFSPEGHQKIPQLGRVIVQDDVEIGANTTIDRGATEDTVIGEGTKIDNLVQIGHNCRIGRHCIIVSQVGLSGSVVLEDYVVLGGQVGIADHVTLCTGAKVAAQGGVMHNMPAGAVFGGSPAKPIRQFHKETIALKKLVNPPAPKSSSGDTRDNNSDV